MEGAIQLAEQVDNAHNMVLQVCLEVSEITSKVMDWSHKMVSTAEAQTESQLVGKFACR